MEDTVSAAKAEFIRAKDRITNALATTPDDRINWSPSPTSRTPIQHVGHVATTNLILWNLILGKPFPFTSLAAADAAAREEEKQYTTRAQVLALLDQTSSQYLAWLDTLTPAQLGSIVQMPFGARVMSEVITLPADHLRGHAAQMDYMQTIYGDHEWHR